MLWEVHGQPIDGGDWESLRPDRVLFEFDGPLMFTVKDKKGGLNLAYFCDGSETATPVVRRYFVAVSSPHIVEALVTGRCSMRESLDQPRTWLVDVGTDWAVRRYWAVSPGDMPPDALPPPSVRLDPALEPLVSLRAVGSEIQAGSIPGEVVKHLVTGVEGALKRLLDYVLDREPTGRVPNSMRRMYALPVQSFAFNSFQVDFVDPERGQLPLAEEYDEPSAKAFQESVKLLNEGLEWASKGFPKALVESGDRDRSQAIMEALKSLTPSSHGKIERLEVAGRVRGGGQKVKFTKESRREVTLVLKGLNQPRPEPFDDEGVVRELDLDALTFMLRERRHSKGEVNCSFDQEQLDSILGAFNGGDRVRVLGVQAPRSKVVDVLLVTDAEGGDEEPPPPPPGGH